MVRKHCFLNLLCVYEMNENVVVKYKTDKRLHIFNMFTGKGQVHFIYMSLVSVLTTILFIIVLKFIKLYYMLHSPQVKRNMISSLKNLKYDFPNEFTKKLRLRILAN